MSRDPNLLRPELLAIWLDISAIWKQMYPKLPQPFLVCTYRPNVEQEADYAQGRTMPGYIITNARANESPHNTYPSSAFDLGFITADKKADWQLENFHMFNGLVQKKYADVITYGGNFNRIKDNDHWELKDWKKYRDAIT